MLLELHLIISTTQIVNPIAELVIPIRIPEIEIHQVIAEAKTRKCSI